MLQRNTSGVDHMFTVAANVGPRGAPHLAQTHVPAGALIDYPHLVDGFTEEARQDPDEPLTLFVAADAPGYIDEQDA